MSTQFTNRQWRLPNNENKDKQSNYSIDKFDLNDYISTPLTIDEFSSATMSIWFKTSLSQNDKYFLTFPEASGANGFDLNFVTSGIKSYLQCHSGSNSLTSSFTYNDGNWHHVIVSYSGTNHKMYIDGVLTASASASIGTIKNAEGNLYIGGLSSLYPAYRVSQTKLDQVAVFDYALSDGGVSVGQTATGQIATLYGGGSAIGNPMSLSPAPVAYYPLGDQDSFNNSNYLVPNSSLKDYVFDFDGSNDYIDTNSTFNTLTSFSISAWFKADDTAGVVRSIVSTRDHGLLNSQGLDMYINGNVLTGRVYSNGATEVTQSFTDTTNWHHVALTYNGSTLEFFLDGSSLGTATGSYDNTSGKNLLIGKWGYSSYYFDGSISNVQIFNTALPATGSNSVETLYNNGSPLTSMSGFTSLQGWWKLNASDTYDSSTTTWTIADSSSNSNNGTSSGMTQSALQQSDLSFKTSYSPYALDFDGTNDYIDCGSPSTLDFERTDAFSISAWVKRVGSGSYQSIVYKANNNSPYNGYAFYIDNNNKVGFNITINYNSSNYFGKVCTSVLNTDWNNVLITYNGNSNVSGLNIYINGSLQTVTTVGTSSDLTGTLSNSIPFNIGARNNTDVFLDGKLSNVSIWNTALTSSQVTEIYNEGVPSNLNNHSAYSNLVSWWQLGSNSSFNTNWTVLDEKGSNNGTSVNMTEADIVDGVGSYANGLSSGMGGDEVIGDAPYSSSNSLSVNMDVEDRTTDTPS